MPRLQARRTRLAVQLSGQPISAEHMHALVLLETGDVQEAERAANEIIAAQLRAGMTPK